MELIRNQKHFEERKQDVPTGDVINQPKEFPCWMYWYVSDWSREEETACYYYKDDLQKMLCVMEEITAFNAL